MRHPLLIACLVVVVASLSSCKHAQETSPVEFDVLTVKGATKIEQHRLQGVAAKQLNYVLNIEYPQKGVDHPHYKKLESLGWKVCTGTNERWESYIDSIDRQNPHCVFRFGKYLIKQNNLMLISLRYQSELAAKSSCKSKPDNANQFVIAVIHEHQSRESMQLSKLGLSCPG